MRTNIRKFKCTDQYEFTATSNQTVFGGLGVDKLITEQSHYALPSGDVDVFIDGVLKSENTYSVALDKITFTTNPNLSGGEIVEIVADLNNIFFEDAYTQESEVVSNIFRVNATQSNTKCTNYKSLAVMKKYQQYFMVVISIFRPIWLLSRFICHWCTSNATGTILRIDTDKADCYQKVEF